MACGWARAAKRQTRCAAQREAAKEAAAEPGAQVDNMEAGGFFARFGRERNAPRPRVIPPAPTQAEAMDGAAPAPSPTQAEAMDVDVDSD